MRPLSARPSGPRPTPKRRTPAVRLREVRDAVRLYAVLALFGVLSLAWGLVAAVLSWIVPRGRGVAFGQWAIMAWFRFYVAVLRAAGLVYADLAALDALRGERALILACNHPTLLDAVLVISRLPRIACITKAENWDNPFLGGGARLAGYIRNDSPLGLVRRSVEALRRGHQLLIFPEGTRTVRPPVNRFRGGFALTAKQAGVPVQTVFIRTDSPYLTKGWGLFRRPAFPIHYRVTLGRRFEVTGDAQEFVARLEAYFAEELGAGASPPAA